MALLSHDYTIPFTLKANQHDSDLNKPQPVSGCIHPSFCSVVTAQQSPLEIAARNKATTLKSYTDFNSRQLDNLPKLYAPDFVDRTNPVVKGPEGVKADFLNTFKIWPDVQVKVEQVVAEGDWVMARCVTWATHTSEVMGVKGIKVWFKEAQKENIKVSSNHFSFVINGDMAFVAYDSGHQNAAGKTTLMRDYRTLLRSKGQWKILAVQAFVDHNSGK